jgi:hypothetical protein
MKFSDERIIKITKIVIWLTPIIILVFILNQHFVLNGKFTVHYKVSQQNPLVKNFAQKESEKLIGTKNVPGDHEYFQLITKNPLYFDVKVPRSFQTAKATIIYQNPNQQPIVQLGVKQANDVFHTVDMAYTNTTLNTLADYWEKIQVGPLVLWQKNQEYYSNLMNKNAIFSSRKKKLDQWREDEQAKLDEGVKNALSSSEISNQYNQELQKITIEKQVEKTGGVIYQSINDFFNNIPSRKSIVSFNYDLSNYYSLPDYQPSTSASEINQSIRGKHEIYTYLGDNEDLNYSFTFQDSNRHEGADPFIVRVYNVTGKLIKTISVSDTSSIAGDSKVSREQSKQLLISDLPHGVYRIVIDVNDDIFIKKIVTMQHLFMFKGNIYLTDSSSYKDILGGKINNPGLVYTNCKKISALTSHKENLQTLSVGSKDLRITKTNTPFESSILKDISIIVSPKNDVNIEGDGFFSFSKDSFFDSSVTIPLNLDQVTNINNYDYIIADYPQASVEGDWLSASGAIEAPFLYVDQSENSVVHFEISMPGLPESNRSLKIKEVTIQFQKEPITIKNFFSKFNSWFKRVIIKK